MGLLEKISIQLGADDPNHIMVENLSTGKLEKLDIHEWNKIKGDEEYKVHKEPVKEILTESKS